MRRIGPTPIKTTSITSATFTLLVAENLNRVYLQVINDTASTFYIAPTNTAPTDVDSATNGMQKLLAGERFFWDLDSVVVTSAIYVYQASGGALNIKYCEGV